MYCKNCGSQIDDEAVVCVNCGTPTDSRASHAAPRRESNPMAIIGFVLSFFATIAGLICSIIAYRRCKDNPNLEGKGFAQAGIIISAVEIAASVLAVIFCWSFFWSLVASIIQNGGM